MTHLKFILICCALILILRSGDSQEITFKIEGTMCQNCADSLTTTLKKVTGVTTVTVSFKEKTARIAGKEITLLALQEAMEKAGYRVDKMKKSIRDKCNPLKCSHNKSGCPAHLNSSE